MDRRTKLLALGGAALGLGAGLAAQHTLVKRRRIGDTESSEPFTRRRGERARTIRTPDGASIFIEETGPVSKSGVVFIHGSALRTDLWHYQMPGIDGRRLVFFDLRGHGRSQRGGLGRTSNKPRKGELEFSVTTLAKDLEAVIEDCGLEEVVLVGHSIGGSVALELCRLHPEWINERIRGLVVANTSARLSQTTAAGEMMIQLDRFLKRPTEFLVGGRSRYLDRLRKIVRPTDTAFLVVSFVAFGGQASAKQVDLTYDMVADTPSETILDLFKAYRTFDMWDELDDILVPTVVISGTEDRITVPSASEHLASRLPKAELIMLEGCGHMSMLERHEEFNTILSSFIADHLG